MLSEWRLGRLRDARRMPIVHRHLCAEIRDEVEATPPPTVRLRAQYSRTFGSSAATFSEKITGKSARCRSCSGGSSKMIVRGAACHATLDQPRAASPWPSVRRQSFEQRSTSSKRLKA